VEVVTDGGTYLADRVVVSSDAWTNEVLRDTGTRIPLTVTQEQVSYYATPNLREFSPERFPVFMWHGRDNFYGFPVYGPNGDRVCERAGASSVAEVDLGLPERWLYSFGSTLPGQRETLAPHPVPESDQLSDQKPVTGPARQKVEPLSVSQTALGRAWVAPPHSTRPFAAARHWPYHWSGPSREGRTAWKRSSSARRSRAA
jgi:hypothetical protein